MAETTRKRKTQLPSADKNDKHITRGHQPPLKNISLNRFIYILTFLSVLLASYYCWKIVQLEREVGGWWNLALHKRPPQIQNQVPGTPEDSTSSAGTGSRGGVEDKINELAAVLGMPSKVLASAIADVVREYVPPVSLSSIASQETGEVVQQLVNQEEGQEQGVAGGLGHIVESVIGLDDIPEDI